MRKNIFSGLIKSIEDNLAVFIMVGMIAIFTSIIGFSKLAYESINSYEKSNESNLDLKSELNSHSEIIKLLEISIVENRNLATEIMRVRFKDSIDLLEKQSTKLRDNREHDVHLVDMQAGVNFCYGSLYNEFIDDLGNAEKRKVSRYCEEVNDYVDGNY